MKKVNNKSKTFIIDTFVSTFEKALKIKDHKPFLIVGRETLSYGELLKQIAKLTKLFQDNGLNEGDRVIIATKDDIEMVVFLLSLIRNGFVAVIIDPGLPPQAAKNLINKTNARGIIIDNNLQENWQMNNLHFTLKIKKERKSGVRILKNFLKQKEQEHIATDTYPAILDNLKLGKPPSNLSDELIAIILFTSGTISHPKGVQLSHKNLRYHLGTLTKQFGYDQSSRILNILPLHHTDGITQGPIVAFWNGASVYRPLPFTIPNIGPLLDTIYRERISHFILVPTILNLIQKFGQDFKDNFTSENFQFIISAAAQLDGELWASFEKFFDVRIANVYGLTESVTGGLFSGPSDKDHCYGTIGKPVDCEACIVNEQGKEILDDSSGELLLRGNNIMNGYLNSPEATSLILKNGWLHTGDIATRDNEGFFRIVGRKKNVIISGGINIHPEEITEVLNNHIDIIEACTFGVKDEIWGEQVISAVVIDSKNQIDDKDLIKFCRNHLAPTKIPYKIHILTSLPKGPSGKIILNEVKKTVAKKLINKLDSNEINLQNRILKIASYCFNTPIYNLNSGSGYDNLAGWDSLAHLQFIVELEDAFNIHLSPREIMKIDSLYNAEQIINEKQ